MRDKILSTDYCVTDKIGSTSDADITTSACHMREENSTSHEWIKVCTVCNVYCGDVIE